MQKTKLTTALASRRGAGSRLQRGMTLIEWMVSITIGMILLIGLTALIAQQSRTQAELEKSSRQIENGRYAMELLKEEIRHAGFYGEFVDAGQMLLPTAIPNPCSVTAAELSAALPFHVQGFDAPTGLPTAFAGCPASFVAANRVPGTDILVIRRVDPTTIPGTGTLVIGQTYLQSGLNGILFEHRLAAAASTSVNTATFSLLKRDFTSADPNARITADLRKYEVQIYFISPCSVPVGTNCSAAHTDDGGVSIPTLKRLELTVDGNAPKFKMVSLVEGIENMQIDYGFDEEITTGDGSPDGVYKKDATTVQKWADVMAIRLHILARSTERTGGYEDKHAYDLGFAGLAATDGATAVPGKAITMTLDKPTPDLAKQFKRRVFSQLIRVVNPSARREQ